MAQQARRERKTIDNRFSGADRSTKSRNNKTKQLMRGEAHVLAKDTTQEVAIVNEHFKSQYAAMAQQVEHVLGKDEVTGSNPVSSST